MAKADKNFAKRLDFKDIKFPVKVRNAHKIEKKSSINSSVFGHENKEKHPIYVSKNVKKTRSLLLIQDEGKRHYVHIRDLNTFMYDHILHCGRKHFC